MAHVALAELQALRRAREDVDLILLNERLELLSLQRALAARSCHRFAAMLEGNLSSSNHLPSPSKQRGSRPQPPRSHRPRRSSLDGDACAPKPQQSTASVGGLLSKPPTVGPTTSKAASRRKSLGDVSGASSARHVARSSLAHPPESSGNSKSIPRSGSANAEPGRRSARQGRAGYSLNIAPPSIEVAPRTVNAVNEVNAVNAVNTVNMCNAVSLHPVTNLNNIHTTTNGDPENLVPPRNHRRSSLDSVYPPTLTSANLSASAWSRPERRRGRMTSMDFDMDPEAAEYYGKWRGRSFSPEACSSPHAHSESGDKGASMGKPRSCSVGGGAWAETPQSNSSDLAHWQREDASTSIDTSPRGCLGAARPCVVVSSAAAEGGCACVGAHRGKPSNNPCGPQPTKSQPSRFDMMGISDLSEEAATSDDSDFMDFPYVTKTLAIYTRA